VKDPAPPCWARVREYHVPDGDPAPLWRHAETRDTWRGALAHGRPDGRGIYNFHLTKLCLGGTVRARVREGGPRGAQDDVVFAGPASASWPDGARYEGELALSKMHGRGRYVWPNGDVYDGEWRAGRRHGAGTLCSWSADSALLRVEALGPGRRAYALRYCGAWEDNVFAGQGVMEFFDAPPGAAGAAAVHDDPPFSGTSTCSKTRRLPAGRELLRRFEGLFRAGFPARGRLETRAGAGGPSGAPPGGLRETFEQVHFDGATCAGSFATWYWAPAEAAAGAPEAGAPEGPAPEPAQSRGGALEALAEHGEERAAVASRFLASMRAVRGVRIDAVERVRNNDLRAIFELQRRALQRKVTAPPRSLPWNPRTMEAWAFHAPGPSSAPPGAARAAPWESIVEEGFQATLAGSDNGRVFGAGVYFAHDALLSHRYALQSAKADPGPLRMFLSRIVTGISTGARVGLPEKKDHLPGAARSRSRSRSRSRADALALCRAVGSVLRDGTLPDATGSRHRTQPAHAGAGGHRTTVDSLELLMT
jgi:hypothetical protein